MNTDISQEKSKFIRDYSDLSLLVIFLLLTIFIFLTFINLMKNAFHGIDISDEGMYLLSVHNVSKEMSFHNPFGDYTGILFKLCLKKVWLFRIGGYYVLGLSGVYLSRSFLKFLPLNSHRILQWTVTISGLLVVPFYYGLGILTPSYNWLNLCCISLGLGAIIRLHKPASEKFVSLILTNFSLSAAIWIGTFAKLSTGPGIFLMSLAVTLLLREPLKIIAKNLGIQSASIFFIAAAHQIFISPLSVVAEKISRGQHALQILDPQYSISLAIHSFKIGAINWLQTLLGVQFFLMLGFILLFVAVIHRWANELGRSGLTILLVLFPLLSANGSFSRGDWSGVVAKYNEQMWAATHILSISVAIFLVSCVYRKRFNYSLVLAGLAILGGVVLYAFGSNNGFIEQITGATGLIALLAILLLTIDQINKGILLAITCLVLSVGGFNTTLEAARNPYRQSPISQQDVLIEINPGAGRLYVERNFAKDVNSLRSQLRTKGWHARTPLLDFTQYSAGMVYALDAQQPITVIPTVGGMSGVNALAEWSYSYIAQHDSTGIWHSAWLLLPSEKNLATCQLCPNTSVLRQLERVFPNDYELVAVSDNFQIYKPRY